MTLLDAIETRHCVRKYQHKPLPKEIVEALLYKIAECNEQGNLHIQLVTNETKAFTGILSYGQFSGVENYFVMAGKKADDLDCRVGYYGEQLVLLSQQLGLNTCWVGISYRKVKEAFTIEEDEKIACLIAVGYGETQGEGHKFRKDCEVSNASDVTPKWFRKGVKATLLAPSAFNQQRFHFEYL